MNLFTAILLALFPPSIDKAFQSYYDSFLHEAEIRHYSKYTETSIRFGEIPGSSESEIHVGMCVLGGGGRRNVVTIDEVYWQAATPITKELLIYHELGHCMLEKKHTNFGIMYYSVSHEKDYMRHKKAYLDLLFASSRRR